MYSGRLSEFLEFMREAQSDYNIACQTESEAFAETQDIEHCLELCRLDYHEYARLAKAAAEVRQKRRQAKDARLQLQPVVDWLAENGQVIKGLERLLGAVRREERAQQGRQYKPKSGIVARTLQKEVWSNGDQ